MLFRRIIIGGGGVYQDVESGNYNIYSASALT